jgi:hypothetical protein
MPMPMTMLSKAIVAAAALAASSLVVGVGPADAQISTPITNLPQNIPFRQNVGLTALGFNCTNFPGMTGCGTSNPPRLTSIRLQITGVLNGIFTIVNNDFTLLNINSISLVSLNFIANNTRSISILTTNTTGSVPGQTIDSVSFNPVPCTFPATPQTIIFGGLTLYSCQTPGSASFTLNPSATPTTVNFSIAPSSSQIHGPGDIFWYMNMVNIPTSLYLDFNNILPATASVDFIGATFDVTSGIVDATYLRSMSDESDLTILGEVDDNYIIYEYENAPITDPLPVPAPLPIFGTIAAFVCSRRLRRRIKAAV